jgi:hypothetical protein
MPGVRSSGVLVRRAARIAAGAQLRVEVQQANAASALQLQLAQAQLAQPRLPSSSSNKVVKLSQVIDQTAEDAVLMDATAIAAAYACYDARLGGAPPEDHEPTYEQLTAMHHLNQQGLVPYTDFAVWGPHAVRIVRKLNWKGLLLSPSGELFRSEMNGPTSYEQWEACYMVFRTAAVMLDIATPAALDSYKDHVKQYAWRYTADSWALLYQSDARASRELSERIRRRGQSLYDKARQSGVGTGTIVLCDFDPTKPWDYVFRQLSTEFSFRKRELEGRTRRC